MSTHLRKRFQLFPSLIGGSQLLLQLLEASLLCRDLRTRLLIKLRLIQPVMESRGLRIILLDCFGQGLQLFAFFERQLSLDRGGRLRTSRGRASNWSYVRWRGCDRLSLPDPIVV